MWILDISGFVCNICINKFNCVLKLNKDLEIRIIKIKNEWDKLILILLDMLGVWCFEC